MAENNEKNSERVGYHTKNGIDYLALREFYEEKGNQGKIDYIITKYLRFCKYDSLSPVLNGVTLSEEAINALSTEQVITLVHNDAKPTESLKKFLLNPDNTSCHGLQYFDLLYRKGKLTIREFEAIVLSSREKYKDINRRIDNILEILESDTLKDYEGIDLEKIESILLSFLKDRRPSSITDSLDRIVRAMVKLLIIAPYNEIMNDKLVEHLLNFRKQANPTNLGCSPFDNVSRCITEALNTYFFKEDIHILKLLDLLSVRPDLVKLARAMGYILDDVVKTILLESIIDGKCKHIAFAMYLSPDIWYHNTGDIINEWVKNDMELELDIYLPRFFDSMQPLSLKEALELDTKYIAAMTPEQGESFQMKPKDK